MEDNRVGIRELKSKLSAYLRRVKTGETIIVTEYGEPIGQIVPVKTNLEERMQTLMDAGLLAWNGKPFKPRPPAAVNYAERQLSELIEADRNIDALS